MNACKSFSLLRVFASAALLFGAAMSADAQISEQEVVAPQAECYYAVGDHVGINHGYLAVSVPTNYPFANGGGVVYSRSSAGYTPTYLAAESDWSGTVLAMQGATLLVARPYAQHFGSGDVTAFSLVP